MIKKCKVTLRSGDLIVVNFDGVEVQLTDKNHSDELYIELNDGVYSVSDESAYEASLKPIKKKTKTNKNIVSENVVSDDSGLN